MELVAFGCRCLVGLAFVLSAAGKLRDRAAFAEFAASVRTLVPWARAGSGPLAKGTVATEIAIPLLLAIPGAASAGAALAAVSLLAFSTVIVFALRRGPAPPCRCFGASAVPLGRRHLVRNGLLFAAALAAPWGGSAETAGVVIAGCAGAVLAVLIARFDELTALFLPVKKGLS